MLTIVAPAKLDDVREVCGRWDLDATVIGEVTDSSMLRVLWHGEMRRRHPGAPARRRVARHPHALVQAGLPRRRPGRRHERRLPGPGRPGRRAARAARRAQHRQQALGLRAVRLHRRRPTPCRSPAPTPPCCASRARHAASPSSTDCNGRHCYLDPYRGAKAAVAEAARNLSCAGALPVAVTDCLNFGNPEKGDIYWQFEQAVEGMAEACEALRHAGGLGQRELLQRELRQRHLPDAGGRHAGRLRRRRRGTWTTRFKRRGRPGRAARPGRRGLAGRLRVPEGPLRPRRGPRARRRPRAREPRCKRRCAKASAPASSRAPTTAPRAAWPSPWPSAPSPAARRAAPLRRPRGALGPARPLSRRRRRRAQRPRPDLALFAEGPSRVLVTVRPDHLAALLHLLDGSAARRARQGDWRRRAGYHG